MTTARLLALIFPSWDNGERQVILDPVEVTNSVDRAARQTRYRGFCPVLRKKVMVELRRCG